MRRRGGRRTTGIFLTRDFGFGLLLLLLGSIVDCRAGAADKLPVIGQIYFGSVALARPSDDAFREGLRELGYVDGKNITILPLYANGREEQVPVLVNQLVIARVDVMFVSIKAVRAAMQATKTIPIICPYIGDPVKGGLVTSLARPGVNFTGISGQNWDTDSKRLELAMEIKPGLKRIGVIYDANFRDDEASLEQLRGLARRKGIAMHLIGVRNLDEIHGVVAKIDTLKDQLLIVSATPFTNLHRDIIMKLVAHKLPVITDGREWAEPGAVITYAANALDLYRRSASYVDKILKGAHPGNLPIEQANSFELVVNLKAAKELGVSIPQSILLRADEVIR